MSLSDLEAYWEKPFTVKPEIGFYAWRKITKLRLVDDRVLSEPEFLAEAFMNFFSDKSKLEKFIGESIFMAVQAFIRWGNVVRGVNESAKWWYWMIILILMIDLFD